MAEDIIEDNQTESAPEETPTGNEPKLTFGQTISRFFSAIFGASDKPKEGGQKAKAAPGAQNSSGSVFEVINVQKINLKTINQILIALLVTLVFLMIYVAFRPGPDIASVMSVVSRIQFPVMESKTITPFEEIAYYLNQIRRRDVFSVYREKVEVIEVSETVEEPSPPVPEPKVPIEEKARNIKLIGISWGGNPKAIIRDLSTQTMYFVSEGETIEGTDLTVKEVFKEQVIITSEGDEMTLL